MALVDIIMAAYNEEKRIEAAIESILAQTFCDWRLLICDDGSTDDTMSVILRYAEQYPQKIFVMQNQTNKGLTYTLNRLIKIVDSKYVARMDADDRSRETRLEKEIDFLNNNPQYAFVGTAVEKYDEEGFFSVIRFPEKPEKRDFLWNNPFAHPTILMRSDVLKNLNGYRDESYTLRNEDYDLWMRMYASGFKGYNLKEPLLDYYEGRYSYSKRKFKYRIAEMKTRYMGYKGMGLMPLGVVFMVKPLLVGLIPAQIMIIIRKGKHKC